MRTRIFVAVAMCIVILTTSDVGRAGQGELSNRDVAARVPTQYRALYEGSIPTDKVAQVWAGLPYDSIELERTACFGTCPVYRVKLSKGGKAELRRSQHMESIGDFVGEVSVVEYGKICYLMTKLDFHELPARFSASWTDAPTVIVRATAGQSRKVVSDYSSVGPIELWAMQQTIDAVTQRIRWARK